MAKDKKHQLDIVSTASFLDASALNIPMLQILKEDGTIHKGAEVPDLDKDTACKIFSDHAIHPNS